MTIPKSTTIELPLEIGNVEFMCDVTFTFYPAVPMRYPDFKQPGEPPVDEEWEFERLVIKVPRPESYFKTERLDKSTYIEVDASGLLENDDMIDYLIDQCRDYQEAMAEDDRY